MRRSIIPLSLLASPSPLPRRAQGSRRRSLRRSLVITMFGPETAPWLEGRKLDTRVAVPGLSKEFPEVACDAAGLCVMTTSMGYANAATSVSAVILSGEFDLSKTYFLIAGIAGVDPSDATLGSALWARYVIDGGLRHEIDPRQVPADWPNGMLGLGAEAPGEKPTWGAGTEVYHLSDPLVDRALELDQGRRTRRQSRGCCLPSHLRYRGRARCAGHPHLRHRFDGHLLAWIDDRRGHGTVGKGRDRWRGQLLHHPDGGQFHADRTPSRR